MEDKEQVKPRTTASAREAAFRRAAALSRTAKWRDKSHIWPSSPLGQQSPKQVKPAPGPLQLLVLGFCKSLLGVFCGLVLVWVMFCMLIGVLLPYSPNKHPSHESNLLVSIVFLVISTIVFAVPILLTFRKEKFFTLGLSLVGIVWVSLLLLWTKG